METESDKIHKRIELDIRRRARAACGCDQYVRVEIQDGANPPELIGEPGYYTTPLGKTVIHHRRNRMVYHRSTRRIVVGRYWPIPKMEEMHEQYDYNN
jgi:hypothetical protein